MSTLTQSKVGTGASVSTLTVTFDAPPTSGNLMVAAVGYNGSNQPSVAPWSDTVDVTEFAALSASVAIYSKVAGGGEASGVTVTFPATVSSLKMMLWEVAPTSGFTWAGVDQVSSVNGGGSDITTLTAGPTAPLTRSDDFAVTIVNANSSIGGATTPSGWTDSGSIGNNGDVAHRFLASTAALSADWSWVTARRATTAIATYQMASTSTESEWVRAGGAWVAATPKVRAGGAWV